MEYLKRKEFEWETCTQGSRFLLNYCLFAFVSAFFSKAEQNLLLVRDEGIIIHIVNFYIRVVFDLQQKDEDLLVLFMGVYRI